MPRSAREPRLDRLARHARIAVRVEQALLGGDGQAGAVDVDRAAFQDPVVPLGVQVEALGQARAERIVALAADICRPSR